MTAARTITGSSIPAPAATTGRWTKFLPTLRAIDKVTAIAKGRHRRVE